LSPPQLACRIGQPCLAPWTGWTLPFLLIGGSVPITTASPIFAFDLGNGLSQTYLASLTPVFPPQDELQVLIADPARVLGTSDLGRVAFNANSGVDYFLLFVGLGFLVWR
jgi:hypothetical protein